MIETSKCNDGYISKKENVTKECTLNELVYSQVTLDV